MAIRGYDIQETRKNSEGEERIYYPGRDIKMIWDAENMKVTNFDAANQFVKREYPEGFTL